MVHVKVLPIQLLKQLTQVTLLVVWLTWHKDVIVRDDDCGTDRGILAVAIKEGTEEIEKLDERLDWTLCKKKNSTIIQKQTKC